MMVEVITAPVSGSVRSGLPVFDGVPDFVYEITQTPADQFQAQEYLTVLKSELADIEYQMEHGFKEISYQFDGRSQAYDEWRGRLIKAKRTKNNQILLIRAWIGENQGKQRAQKSKNKATSRPGDVLATPGSESALEIEKENLLRRVERLVLCTQIDPKTFVKVQRETKFLRAAIADICEAVLGELAGQSTNDEAIAKLEFLLERLKVNDSAVQLVQSDLRMTA